MRRHFHFLCMQTFGLCLGYKINPHLAAGLI